MENNDELQTLTVLLQLSRTSAVCGNESGPDSTQIQLIPLTLDTLTSCKNRVNEVHNSIYTFVLDLPPYNFKGLDENLGSIALAEVSESQEILSKTTSSPRNRIFCRIILNEEFCYKLQFLQNK